mmetsp:Transcript_92992/g.287028  ORF Transcript_92992/g.287028 Transcript_92992/m.287028 type:complete len:90 (+) Transcript_92992:176-445(+)
MAGLGGGVVVVGAGEPKNCIATAGARWLVLPRRPGAPPTNDSAHMPKAARAQATSRVAAPGRAIADGTGAASLGRRLSEWRGGCALEPK